MERFNKLFQIVFVSLAVIVAASIVTEAEAAPQANPALHNMPENTWLKLRENPEISVSILAYSGMVYDNANHNILLFGGGHNDYWGNEVYQFDFSTLIWKKLYEPTPCNEYANANYDVNRPGMLTHVGLPMSRHTYDQMSFISHLNRLFVHSGVPLFDKTCMTDPRPPTQDSPTPDTWLFEPTTVRWEYKYPSSGTSPGGSIISASEYDPVSKKVYYLHGGSGPRDLYTYTAETNIWSKIGTYQNISGMEYPVVYNSKARSLDMIANGIAHRYYIDQNKWESKIPPQTFSVDSRGLAYDMLNDVLVAYASDRSGNSSVRTYDWDTNQWTQLAPNNPPSPRWEIWPHFIYDPVNNVFIAVIYGPSGFETWAYKYKASSTPFDTTPPTSPTNLTTTAISSSQINLSWAASTDNVGVIGYRIYRDGIQIGTTANTSYSDTGLIANTTYTYIVVAYDAAGNISAQSASASATTSATSPVLTLNHDGPATPEQISVFIPSSLPTTATATLRYRKVGDINWIIGHPLHRIRPGFADSGMAVEDGFAWVIIGLIPGTSYEVEATITNGAQNTVYAGVMTTRTLPAAAGAPTKTIVAGATSAQIQAVFDSAVAGDVIQFANGTYNVSNLTLNRSGTASQPIYIRGQSRAGVVLQNAGRVLHLLNASDIVIENLTLQGSGVDSGTAASSKGISFYDGYIQERVTIRNTTITGVDCGINVNGQAKQLLIYDNTLTGNNQWNQDFYPYGGSGSPGSGNGTPDVDENVFWNDDGVRITGKGNAAFNNTLSGFGDALAMADYYESIGVHFYRNDILMTGDDAIEGDYSKRNITFYDNRVHNAMTLVSLDPIWGGPFVAARNIGINIGRGPYKLNNTNTGHFFYNNTVVNPENRNVWGWVQYNNGDQRAWGYRNNILIYRGSGSLLANEAGGENPIDFTHNSWFPNRSVWWTNSGGSFTSLAAAYTGLPATTPVFSGSSKRHEADNICESNPFVTDINLGADYHTKISTFYIPNLSNGTAPKNSGVAIPNITDGFSGTAPDRGALISGIAVPVWGNRSAAAGLKGDVNKDSSIDILDVQALVNHILGIQDYGASADVNTDGSVDVLDVQEVVNIILGV